MKYEVQKNPARSHPAVSKIAVDRLFLKVPTFSSLIHYLNNLGSFDLGYIEIPARSSYLFGPVTISTTASNGFLTSVTSATSAEEERRMN